MALSHGGEEKVNDVSSALDELSKKWRIDSVVRDVHLRKRKDIQDYSIKINQVTYHLPFTGRGPAVAAVDRDRRPRFGRADGRGA